MGSGGRGSGLNQSGAAFGNLFNSVINDAFSARKRQEALSITDKLFNSLEEQKAQKELNGLIDNLTKSTDSVLVSAFREANPLDESAITQQLDGVKRKNDVSKITSFFTGKMNVDLEQTDNTSLFQEAKDQLFTLFKGHPETHPAGREALAILAKHKARQAFDILAPGLAKSSNLPEAAIRAMGLDGMLAADAIVEKSDINPAGSRPTLGSNLRFVDEYGLDRHGNVGRRPAIADLVAGTITSIGNKEFFSNPTQTTRVLPQTAADIKHRNIVLEKGIAVKGFMKAAYEVSLLLNPLTIHGGAAGLMKFTTGMAQQMAQVVNEFQTASGLSTKNDLTPKEAVEAIREWIPAGLQKAMETDTQLVTSLGMLANTLARMVNPLAKSISAQNLKNAGAIIGAKLSDPKLIGIALKQAANNAAAAFVTQSRGVNLFMGRGINEKDENTDPIDF